MIEKKKKSGLGPQDATFANEGFSAEDIKKLPLAERREYLAAQGDVRGLLDELERGFGGMNTANLDRALRKALQTLARTNPDGLSKFLRAEILSIAGILLLRARSQLHTHLRAEDDTLQRRGVAHPSDADEAFIGRIQALQLHITKLTQIDASIQNQMERTRKMRIANEKAEKKRQRIRRPNRRKEVPNPPPVPPAKPQEPVRTTE